LLRRAGAGLALSENRSRAQHHNGENIFIDSGLVELDTRVGEPVDLVFRTAEVAALLARPTTDLVGATLTINGSPYAQATDTVLDADGATLVYTPNSSDRVLFRTTVNVTTAVGPFPPEAKDWYIELAPRLVRVKAGAAAQVSLSGPPAITSGGSVSVNAVVRDDLGNPIDERVMVRFEDADGNMLGMAPSQYGVAVTQYVPTAATPEITSVKHIVLERSDGSTLPGTEILGKGFSSNCGIYQDKSLLQPDEVERTVKPSKQIFVGAELPGGAEIVVVNPGGAQSRPVRVGK
jgi:hypothetical protein